MKNYLMLGMLILNPTVGFAQSGGGIGNGTDLYECKKDGVTNYELLDVYEARLRNQMPNFAANASAEEVLKTMVDRQKKIDPTYAALIYAEGAKVLSDIRALARGEAPENPLVKVAENSLSPGPDAGRITHPSHCTPMRLIKQDPNPNMAGTRYEVDLNLVRVIDEVSLGISAYHEGLYKIVLANHVQYSVGVRKVAALFFVEPKVLDQSDVTKVFDSTFRDLQAYLRELSAAGVSTYFVQGHPILSDVNRNGLKLPSELKLPNRNAILTYQAELVSPIQKFGLQFERVQFRLDEDLYVLTTSVKGAELKSEIGSVPSFVLKKKGTIERVEWVLKDGQSLLLITHKEPIHGTDGQTVIALDEGLQVRDASLYAPFLNEADQALVKAYYACWRSRLLRESVTASELMNFSGSYSRLMFSKKFDREVLGSEINECKSSVNAEPQKRYSRKSFYTLRTVLSATQPNLDPIANGVIEDLASGAEICDLRVYSAAAAAMLGGFSVNFGHYRCMDFNGYTRTFIGMGGGMEGLGIGAGVNAVRLITEANSNGRNSRFKGMGYEAMTSYGLIFDGSDYPTGSRISHAQFGVLQAFSIRGLFGVRIKSVRNESFWLDRFVKDLNRETVHQNVNQLLTE